MLHYLILVFVLHGRYTTPHLYTYSLPPEEIIIHPKGSTLKSSPFTSPEGMSTLLSCESKYYVVMAFNLNS